MNGSRVVLVCGLGLFASCEMVEAYRTRGPDYAGPEHVTEVIVRAADGRSEAMVVPGEPVRLNVFARDSDGHIYRVANGSLGPARVHVEAPGSAFDRRTFMLTPDPALIEQPGFDGYPVRVTVDGVTTETVLAVDRDAFLGPRPSDVASLQLRVNDEVQPTYLRPGEPVPFDVLVTTKDARRFRLAPADGQRALNASRVRVETHLLEYLPDSRTLLPSADQEQVGEQRYLLEVSYLPRADEAGEAPVVRRQEFVPDFVALLGPTLEQAQDVRIEVGDPPIRGAVVPGTNVKVDLLVRGPNGRWLEARSERNPKGVPMENFTVRTRHAEFNPSTSILTLEEASRALAGQRYEIDVRYLGQSDLRHNRKLDPDFMAPLERYLLKDRRLEFQGEQGPAGSPGAAGGAGLNGASSQAQYGRGSHGSKGQDGGPGSRGGEGGRGPDVEVIAMEVTTLDRSVPLVLFSVTVEGGSPKFYLRRLDEGQTTIRSRGGKGGQGGVGGNGGIGGKGGDGWSTGDGGDGGHAGDGGPGGFGGKGGSIRLIASSQRVVDHFILASVGGPGGDGGPPGSPGLGGKAGGRFTGGNVKTFAEAMGKAANNQKLDAPQATAGNRGNKGNAGRAGPAGAQGPRGDSQADVTSTATAIEQAAPAALRELILF